MHSAVDDHSRLAYSGIHDNEQAVTAAGFWRRARGFFADRSVFVLAVLTDNGSCYRSAHWLKEVVAGGATAQFTRPLPAPKPTASRALQPHPARRMGLCPALHLRRRAPSTTRQLATHLQPSALPHRPRRPTTHQPRRQPPRALQLATPVWRARRSHRDAHAWSVASYAASTVSKRPTVVMGERPAGSSSRR